MFLFATRLESITYSTFSFTVGLSVVMLQSKKTRKIFENFMGSKESKMLGKGVGPKLVGKRILRSLCETILYRTCFGGSLLDFVTLLQIQHLRLHESEHFDLHNINQFTLIKALLCDSALYCQLSMKKSFQRVLCKYNLITI